LGEPEEDKKKGEEKKSKNVVTMNCPKREGKGGQVSTGSRGTKHRWKPKTNNLKGLSSIAKMRSTPTFAHEGGTKRNILITAKLV